MEVGARIERRRNVGDLHDFVRQLHPARAFDHFQGAVVVEHFIAVAGVHRAAVVDDHDAERVHNWPQIFFEVSSSFIFINSGFEPGLIKDPDTAQYNLLYS